MSDSRRESFRKWATFVVSTLALLIACLRDPVMLTFKGTALEVLREELARRDPSSEASRDRRRDVDSEMLRRLDQILEALRDKASARDAEQKHLLELSGRMSALQARLEELARNSRREK